MSETRERARWGKAGQRLTPKPGNPRPGVLTDREAYRLWRAGKLCPDRITMALNLGGHEGPEVDLACKAQEPEVDQWEAGERYPRWEQVVALAELTGVHPSFFAKDPGPPIPVWLTSLWHTMTPAQRMDAVTSWAPPVTAFQKRALDAARLSENPDEMPPDAPLVDSPSD